MSFFPKNINLNFSSHLLPYFFLNLNFQTMTIIDLFMFGANVFARLITGGVLKWTDRKKSGSIKTKISNFI